MSVSGDQIPTPKILSDHNLFILLLYAREIFKHGFDRYIPEKYSYPM